MRSKVARDRGQQLCQFHGKTLFKVLVTTANEVGEVRVHVETDGKDQIERAVAAFNGTWNRVWPTQVVSALFGQPCG